MSNQYFTYFTNACRKQIRTLLLTMCIITVVRHLYQVIIAALTVSELTAGYMYGHGMSVALVWMEIPNVVIGPCTVVVCLFLAYSMAARRSGGLWADTRPPSYDDDAGA